MGSLTLNGSTSGQLTLAPPAAAGTNTLTLPAQTATLITDSSAALNIGSGQIYKDSSGNVGIGTSSPNASYKLTINGGGQTITNSAGNTASIELAGNGNTPGTGSFLLRQDAGSAALIYNRANADMLFATNSAERMRIDSSGRVGIATTPAANRGILQIAPTSQSWFGMSDATAGYNYGTFFQANGSTVLAYIGAGGGNAMTSGAVTDFALRADSGNLLFATNGNNERMRIDSSGNLLVNTTSADARFVVVDSATSGWGARILKSSGSGTPQGLQVVVGQNSSNEVFQCGQGTSFTSPTNLFKVQGNGLINTGTAVVSPYNNTTASAANMVVTSAGDLQRSTSSLKYKTEVKDSTHGLAEVLQLRPVTYKGKNDGNTVFGGLIAEEVDAIGLKEFVQYAEDGSPDALAYGNMVSLLVKAIQEQQLIISDLKSRIAALEAK